MIKQELPFQFNCIDVPEQYKNIFEEMEKNEEEIDLKEFLSNVDVSNFSANDIKLMVIFEYDYSFFKFKYSEINDKEVYGFIHSATEYFFFEE